MFARAFARTLRTLCTSHFIGLLIKTMLLALIAYTVFMVAVGFGLRSFDIFADSTYEWIADIGLTVLLGLGGYLLLPMLLPIIAAFFQESIANRIEGHDYPQFMPPACERPFWKELGEDLKFVLLVLCLNLLLFWTYFTPLAPFTYYGLNGYLIGREFFETAAARHLGKPKAKELRRNNRLPVFMGGVLVVFLTNIPLVQLIAPFVAVTIMVHLFHLLPKPEEILPPVQNTAESA